MKLTPEQVKLLAATVGLRLLEQDLDNVAIRVEALLSAMEQIEAELGRGNERGGADAAGFPAGRFLTIR